jgi:hypothetical protein
MNVSILMKLILYIVRELTRIYKKMNKNNFIRKYGNNFPDHIDLERRWKIYEQEMRMNELIQRSVASGYNSPAFLGISIGFSAISFADQLVGDSSNVDDWNIFFQLPTNGTPFSRVSVNEGTIELYHSTSVQSDITIKQEAFRLNTGIISIVDTGVIEQINASAFSGCSSLVSIDFPNCVQAGVSAFSSCVSLTTVIMPELITAGNTCFASSVSLTTLSCPKLQTAGDSCFSLSNSSSPGQITTLSLPSVVTIGQDCFNFRRSVVNFDLPVLTTAGARSFQNCTGIVNLTLPEVTSIAFQTFSGCTGMSSLNLPKTISITPPPVSSSQNFIIGASNPVVSLSMPLLSTIQGAQTFGGSQVVEFNFPSLVSITAPVYAGGARSDTFSATNAKRYIFPALATVPASTFRNTTYIGTTGDPRIFDLRGCTNLGGSPGYNAVFARIAPTYSTATGSNGVTTLYINPIVLTYNSGGPDVDIGVNQSVNGSLRRQSTTLTINP